MTAARHPGTAPIFRAFSELSSLPPAERREALMLRLEHVWTEAQSKSYTNKHGDEIPNPDGTLQLKVIQAVAVLQGMTGPGADAEASGLERMSDAELVREATKRLPPHEVAALADQLIAMREQPQDWATRRKEHRLDQQAILTTGETDERPEAADPEEVEADRGSFPQSRAGWTGKRE